MTRKLETPGVRGRPRRLSPRVVEVKFTARQGDALRAMRLATGNSISGLIREAVEAYLTAHGYLDRTPPQKGSNNE